MASITSLGTGSGIDLEGIVQKLMSVEEIPLNALKTKESSFQAKISAYGTLKGALSALQTATKALATATTYTNASVSVGDSTIAAVSAASGATTGNFTLGVEQLAQSHVLRSNTNFANTTDTFNTGTISIGVGGATATDVVITSANNTLTGIKDAINAAGAGVTATIVNDGSTNRLLLSANVTGLTASAISVAVTDAGSGGTNALSTLDGSNLFQVQEARDARFSVNGLVITRSSNTVSDVVTGVTLSLAKAGGIGTPLTTQVNVTRDTSTIQKAITSFVTSYNSAVNQIKFYTAYDATSNSASTLTGDSTARAIRTQLSSLVGGSVAGLAGNISRLSDIGISLQKDGTLLADSTKLSAALADTSKDVAGLFSSTSTVNPGLAVSFNTALDGIVGATGLLASRTEGINQTIKGIGKQRDAMSLRLTKIEANYRTQFSRLDATIASMQQTQSYMTQQLDYLKTLATGVNSSSK